MSSGPGKIQRLILSSLSSTPLLYNRLLWELAEANGAIAVVGQYGGFKAGVISRAFAESFRRAVKSLESEDQINVAERKFESLQEALSCSKYLTTCLELYQIREKTKNHILDFILAHAQRKNKIDFEEFTVRFIKEEVPEVFLELKEKWREIEREILSFLSQYPGSLDIWLSIIIRGRYLFEGRKPTFGLPLHSLVTRIIDSSENSLTQEKVHILVDEMSKNESWKVGRIKYDLYQVMNIGRSTRTTSLDESLKKFLFELDQHLYVGMPNHVEPPPRTARGRFATFQSLLERKFDPLVDKILSRDLFKSHKYLSLP